jgi:polysaccharide export outer membrane protein
MTYYLQHIECKADGLKSISSRIASTCMKNYPFLTYQLCLLIFASGMSFAAFAAEDYLIGGGDTVNITVYEQPDLTTTARISQDDGTITFPLLGEVAIVGLSPEDAGRKIEKLLREGGYLRAPQVNLKVQEFRSQKIPVMGQVNKPGEYLLKGESRVADLITQAGGLQEDAADIIVVVKKEGGKSVRHEIDVLRFYEGDMSQNIKVSAGDFLLVPKMNAFYIHGEVKRPGSYRLKRGMNLMQALSVGGGITGRGSLRGIKVTRRLPDGSTEKVGVELTDILKPDDVVYVKERLF